MDKLLLFKNAMESIGVDIEMAQNYPWIYITKINGINVTEKFRSEYGFTIAFRSIKNDSEITFTNKKKLFELISKYV